MRDLNLLQKIGQMLVFGWQGSTDEENYTVSSNARELVEDFQVGGVALFARNINTPEQIASTINEFQSISELPLFVVADQEGGMVTRFKQPFSVFPGNMALGATGSVDYCRKAAEAIALQLRAVGVNFNFAPCVDVNNNPDNPIIGVRSYGESPGLVSVLGAAAVEGYQAGGIIASAKHFPGHGDTSTDTHHALPIIPYDRERLETVELVPFRAVAEAGVESIMTSHIIFPALDKDNPATLSKEILTGLLRELIEFDGLIVTDCLQMKAIADNYGAAKAAIMAVKAGADILLASHCPIFQRELRDSLVKAVKSGEISEERIDESVNRILKVKQKYDLENRRIVDVTNVRQNIMNPDFIRLEKEIAEKAVTLVKNIDGLLPLQFNGTSQIGIIGMHPCSELFATIIREQHKNTQFLSIKGELDAEKMESINALIKDSSAVIVTTFPKEPWTSGLVNEDIQKEIVDYLIKSNTPVIVVAAREPYGLRHFPNARTSIVTYGYPEISIKAAVDIIFGSVQASGRLPVSVPGYAEYGTNA